MVESLWTTLSFHLFGLRFSNVSTNYMSVFLLSRLRQRYVLFRSYVSSGNGTVCTRKVRRKTFRGRQISIINVFVRLHQIKSCDCLNFTDDMIGTDQSYGVDRKANLLVRRYE